MVSFEDPKIKKISEILGNGTCKKILDFLAEKESTKTDISKALRIPLNTVEYNVNKLNESGLIEKSKDYFWSTKGKKIAVYRISNKSIVISPRNSNKMRSILAFIGFSGLAAFVIKILTQKEEVYYATKGVFENNSIIGPASMAGADNIVTATPNAIQLASVEPWFWFLIGAVGIGLLFLILNWKKI